MSPPVALAAPPWPTACAPPRARRFAAEHDTELAVGEGEVVGVLMPQPEGATDGWTAAVRLHGARGAETTAGGAASAPGLVPTEWVDLATPMETLAPFEAAEEGELTVVEGAPCGSSRSPRPAAGVSDARDGRPRVRRPPAAAPAARAHSLAHRPPPPQADASRTSVWSRWAAALPTERGGGRP